MLRAVLVGLLAVTAIGCKSKDETVKAQPGVAAGRVIELVGTVTLHRGAETRPLAKGDNVESDDVIETGADGSVSIELAHNNATWALAANKKVKVRDSLAWNEAKKDKTAQAVEQDSAAAGRHAERNAADTSVSAAAPVAAPKMEREEAAPAPPPPPVAATTTAPPPPKPKAVASPERAKRAASAPAPDKLDDVGVGSLGLTGTGAGGGGTGDGIGLGGAGGRIGDTNASLEARKQIDVRMPELKRCFKETVKVTFKIDAQGRVSLAFDKPLEEREKQCADKVAHMIGFAKSATRVTISITP